MSIWTTLGIERTRDRAAVRRAYAARLKTTNPEDDPDGFKRLREAYDAALGYVDNGYEPYGLDLHDDPESWPDEGDEDAVGPDEAAEVATIVLRRATDRASDEPSAPDPRLELDLAFHRLVALVTGGGPADSDAIRAAGEAILASEALVDVGVYNRIEAGMADLIAYNLPRADPLVIPALQRFDWRARGRTLTVSHAIEIVLAREEDQRFLRQVTAPRHPRHDAFVALTTPPDAKVTGRWRWAFRLPHEVRQLLNDVTHEHTTLYNDLDPAAVDWWREQLDRPAAGPRTAMFVLGGPLLPALAAMVLDPLGLGSLLSAALGYIAGATVALGLAVLKHFAFDLPRHRWRDEWQWGAPAWLQVGWLGAGLATLALAAVLPDHPASVGMVSLLSLGVLVWAFTVGDEVDHDGHLTLIIGRALWGNAMLIIFWGLMMWGRAPLSIAQLSIPLAALAAAFARNPAALFDHWRQLPRGVRIAGIVGAAASGVLIGWLGLANMANPVLTGLAALSVAALCLLERTPAIAHGETAVKVRYYFGVALVIGGGQLLRFLDGQFPTFVIAMAVLIVSVLASLFFSFLEEVEPG